MPPIVLTAVQGLLLLLLYLFVARAVRAVLRDLREAGRGAPRQVARRPQPAAGSRRRKPRAVASELVVHTPEGRPRVVRLDAHDVTFGRAPASTVVLDDAYVSDHHAKVFLSGEEWCVTDLGSTNGTFLNQLKVTSPTPIAAGDQLAIGKTVVQVRK